MKSDVNCVAELRRTYLFGGMEQEHIEPLLESACEMQLQAGEILFRHGEPAERFFYVRQGLIKLFRLSRDGAEKIIEIIRPGETFAEAVMFMGQQGRYPVTAEAICEAHLLAFSQKTFLDLLESSPKACFGLLGSLSRRLHMLVNQIESLTLQNATHRLVAYLLDQIPPGTRSAQLLQLNAPKGVIASRLAIQPETLSRILARLRTGGIIDVQGSRIIVRDLDALKNFAMRPTNEP